MDAYTLSCLVSVVVMVFCRLLTGEHRRHKGEEDAGVQMLDVIPGGNRWSKHWRTGK